MTLGYIAGLFDGEGCVSIYSCYSGSIGKTSRTRLRISIGNTCKPVLLMLQAQFGGFVRHAHYSHEKYSTRQPVYIWGLDGNSAAYFLRKIKHQLRIKRSQAELALEYQKFMTVPKELRCEPINVGVYGKSHWARRPEVVAKELQFKQQMHDLKREIA